MIQKAGRFPADAGYIAASDEMPPAAYGKAMIRPSDPSPDLSAFGTGRHPERPPARQRPDGVDDATITALGKLSEALEVVEAARGFLYQFHRMSGTADLTLQHAVQLLHAAGHSRLADEINDVLVGRDVIAGQWSFQLVEDYDANYWTVFRAADAKARRLTGGVERHVFEAEMKAREQSAGSTKS